MSIAVVGGLKRLEAHYRAEGRRLGVKVKVFNTEPRDLAPRLRNMDAVVVFTNQTSHSAKRVAVRTARKQGIPVHLRHACGVCALRDCVRCVLRGAGKEVKPPAGDPPAGRQDS